MDPDEIAAAVAAQMQPQQQTGSNYDGRVAVNPSTGERVVYRISPGGRGRFVALNSETADPQSRERVEALQQMANVGARTLPQAQRFLQRNFTTPTGGVQNSPTMNSSLRASLAAMRPNMFGAADELRALSSQMVGSNWQPGTTGMFNTATEMEQARQRFPAPTNLGSANADVYLNMMEDMEAQREALADMRQWLSRHTNLNEWDAQWQRREPEVRRQARERGQVWLLEAQRTARRGDAVDSAPPASAPPPGVSASEWQHMTAEERALWRMR